MRKWQVEGWLKGELTGEFTPVEPGDERAGAAGDTELFEQPPRWQEFWEEEVPGGEYAGDTEVPAVPVEWEAGEPGEGGDAEPAPTVDELTGVSAKRLWTWAFIVAALGVAARAVWYYRFRDEFHLRLGPHGMTFINQAAAYMHGGIGHAGAGPLAAGAREVQPPGYSLLLAAEFEPFGAGKAVGLHEAPLLAVRAVQWLMAGGVTLMTFALARRVLFGWTALVPAVLVTLSIGLIDLPNLMANETLLVFLLTAVVLLLIKSSEEEAGASAQRSYAVLAALLYSYALLTQPRLVILLPFAVLWLGRVTLTRNAVVFAIVALLLPVAWIARDYALYDTFVPVSIAGQVALYTDNVDPVGGPGTAPLAAPAQCPRTRLLTGPIDQRFAWARCMESQGFQEIGDHPGESLKAIPDRIAALFSPWTPPHARGLYSTPHWRYTYVLPGSVKNASSFPQTDKILNYVWIGGYLLLLVIGLFAMWAEGPLSSARIILLPVVTLPLIHLVLHAENRLRVAFLPMALIALTLGAMTLFEALRRDVGRRRPA